eukprot:CAMPEP_0197672902 /NCGR_PEP_ID=MMETSP1338-20131121/79891_1 /TAXON_ID=43686 ORGANISM="Pelagodinium beii, Strain RCC1491" /NCGR_SAMPLE_ID=MMETSP1338 /ASSEMBLY_ACC=CAM_ASM_000754 /LENGTH=66 /DNA_ID=CAMNT_0043253067 /DNA_START=32 /DNA_END=232 /DNA_ORIENTATION=-
MARGAIGDDCLGPKAVPRRLGSEEGCVSVERADCRLADVKGGGDPEGEGSSACDLSLPGVGSGTPV